MAAEPRRLRAGYGTVLLLLAGCSGHGPTKPPGPSSHLEPLAVALPACPSSSPSIGVYGDWLAERVATAAGRAVVMDTEGFSLVDPARRKPHIRLVQPVAPTLQPCFATDGRHVYWTEATSKGRFSCAAVDETDFYWLDVPLGGPVMRTPKSGGEAVTVMYADEIALSGSHLYAAWCERMGIISEDRSPAEHVRRVPVAGGSAELVARSTPTKPSQVAVDNGPCHIARVPKRREEAAVIWSGQSVRSVSADDDVVCFTQSASVSCMSANGGKVTVVAESDRQPQRVAVQDGVVYWTEIDGMHRNDPDRKRRGIDGASLLAAPVSGAAEPRALYRDGMAYDVAAADGHVFAATSCGVLHFPPGAVLF